jgi:hypothetical protein
MRKHVDVGMVEAGRQQVVDCRLEGRHVVEDRNGFRHD